MSDPLALQILEAVQTRLQGITASTYNTDAGNRVHLGRHRINPDELDIGPVLCIYDTDDAVDEDTACGDEEIHITMTIAVEGLIRDFNNEGTRLMHLLVQDVKTAVLDVTDRTLGGLTLDVGYGGRAVQYPEPGGDTLAVALNFTFLYAEPYGSP